MKSFKYNYTIYNFIICLKSIKLYQADTFHINKLYQKKIFNSNQNLILINKILNIRKKSKEKKYRINNIIKHHSSSAQTKHSLLFHKYIQNFTYQYKEQSKYNFEHCVNINTKKNNVIQTVAFTYVYILYKLLNSKNPIYIYYYLTRQNTKL